ncbi:MAG: hypothetical protein HUJ31_04120 [Pseudomonadales bacterium]|nr:hypothetical protein [Pseudomonadales bacterium]
MPMQTGDHRLHYLARVIYPPRILIYASAVAITASGFLYDGFTLPQVLLCILLLSYPHLARAVSCLRYSPDAIRYSLIVDGVLVGLLILGNGLQPMSSVVFLTALVISTQIVAGTRLLAANLVVVSLVVLSGLPILDEVLYRESRLLTDMLSAISLLFYAALVGSIGFTEMASLIGSRVKVNERRHRLEDITDRLRRYISPQIFSSLAADGVSDITRRRRLTVFFSDIEGFTRLMDRLDEGTVTRLLNEYLTDMAAIALRHGGTVDKFMGDGVMVFFGDPVSKGPREDAVACVRMALAMRDRLNALRDRWGGDLHIRIGIHTGYCAVGNFGSEDRMDYTIIGGTVNLASRLESQAGRNEIVISGDTHALVAGTFRCVPKTRTRLRGIARPVTLYSVMPWHGDTGGQEADRQVIRLLD